MTARFDNAIGRVAIPLAYRHCGVDVERSLSDSPALHMAYTTIHQIEMTRAYARGHLNGRYLEVRFEDILKDPQRSRLRVAAWLGTTLVDNALAGEIDSDRASKPTHKYSEDVEQSVKEILSRLRQKLGY